MDGAGLCAGRTGIYWDETKRLISQHQAALSFDPWIDYKPLKGLPLDVILPDKFDYLLLCAARIPRDNKAVNNSLHAFRSFKKNKQKVIGNIPEGRSATEHARLGTRFLLDRRAAEEAVVLHAFLPEILALVPTFELELHHVLVTPLLMMRAESSLTFPSSRFLQQETGRILREIPGGA